MKVNFYNKLILLIFSSVLFSCNTYDFLIINDSDYHKENELVRLELKKLKQGNYDNFSIESYSQNSKRKNIVKSEKTENYLVLLDTFMPNEKKLYKINKKVNINTGNTDNKKYTNIRFGSLIKPYKELNNIKRLTTDDPEKASDIFQMEGPAWENDKVAFRNYFDSRNSMDIFGKRVSSMVLDSVGLPGSNYHQLADWGMDILKVGNSLGAGSIALLLGDTIYPVRNAKNSYFKVITETDFFSAFEISFKDFKIKDRYYDISHIISILPGKYYYNSTVMIDGIRGDEKLVTGIVNMHSDTLYSMEKNGKIAYYTFDKQTENNDNLGMCLLVDKRDYNACLKDKAITKDIDNTYMISLNIANKQPVSFRFYAAWEFSDKSFEYIQGFVGLIEKDIMSDSQALKIKYHNKK